MMLDAITSLGGLIIPPVFDFIKKKFLKKDDTAEATLSTLATTSPATMPAYVEANAKLLDSEINFFNRDVIGVPSAWITDLRAAIRPTFIILAMVIILVDLLIIKVDLPEGIRLFFEAIISSWFGSRLTQ